MRYALIDFVVRVTIAVILILLLCYLAVRTVEVEVQEAAFRHSVAIPD